ncbi:HPr kinase/phosphorylase [Tsuneonella sp. HG222]
MTGLLANVTCVAIGGRGLLIEGASGSGKSTLALMLLDRGAQLVGDDGVTLEVEGDRVIAAPPPHTAGKLEIRNVGLIDLPAVSAPLALVVRLDPEAPRFIAAPGAAEVAGQALPLVRLYPDTPALPLRVEWALRQFGLP